MRDKLWLDRPFGSYPNHIFNGFAVTMIMYDMKKIFNCLASK